MYKSLFVFCLTLCFIKPANAQQPLRFKNNEAGTLQLGLRTDYSFFQHQNFNNQSEGLGGDMRLLLGKQVNTEWFADYFRGNEGSGFTRSDYHIGWSVMFYPQNKMRRIQPYVFAGHCFDYSRLIANSDRNVNENRWSAAVQGGVGTHINISLRSNISLSYQYMLHLGNDIEALKDNGMPVIQISDKSTPESHMLLCLSFNYKISDLW